MSELHYAGLSELRTLMEAGDLTAQALTEACERRARDLDGTGPSLRSVITINPRAAEVAASLDAERKRNGARGPLHGIPVLLKDNIDTADLPTTAGSLALQGTPPPEDAPVAARLRKAGAVILGKANMSEWANFRSTHASSGWSAAGGQCRNPYALDRSPCGSSSGSAVAVAAGLVPASVGTETDGSILCPASINGVVGIKPTVGLTSRAGVVPISHSQDTVGPFARSVRDAALLLSAIAGPDRRDPATRAARGRVSADYAAHAGADDLRGVRIGVARKVYFGYSDKADAIAEACLPLLRELGAEVVEGADIPTAERIQAAGGEAELLVLRYELKEDLNRYLAGRGRRDVHSLEDVIRFNEEHRAEEMPYFGQEHFLAAQEKGDLSSPDYRRALAACRRLARSEGIDAALREHHLDALFMPSNTPAWAIDLVLGDFYSGSSSQPAALAGYPAISVPAGLSFGLPVGVTFMGAAWSEPTLIRIAHAFEQARQAWREPTFANSAQL